ncbi:GGDEF domain-containing protein [Halodesulfovibrio marinisediminis]|uniref:diguanylate cyclase n=1 Tax=Halodesulfovibrio marinisediminis DSM 17456 TaxID=1121457 RepID=A0A1N6DYP8_9BACT|nr:GGDEF domain-containing protein [Halodesulfovibrio marinisediminis]SIN75895.1 diguanylate cyclase (GGDEF) domain-containing protein [Halodesulfovibrio marinisediminis DSM 17456]
MHSDNPSKKICRFEVGHKYCDLFERLGVPRDDRWRSLLSCLRSTQKYSYYSQEQKKQVADLLIKTLEDADFSEERYCSVLREYQAILASSYAKRLEEALQESADLADDFRRSVYHHKGAVEGLEEKSVAAVRSGADPEDIVAQLRDTFQEVISVLKEDAERLDHICKTDGLTGLFNRRAFDENLKEGVKAWESDKKPLCLLLLDVDNLKEFNDRFGHRIGDQALQTFSQIMQAVAHRSHDDDDICCCRFGGDEFAILLFGDAVTDVVEIAQAIRSRLETYDFVIRDNQGRIIKRNVQMTVSCGFAYAHDFSFDNLGARILDAADSALYEAKDLGRNRVVEYSRKDDSCKFTVLSGGDVA